MCFNDYVSLFLVIVCSAVLVCLYQKVISIIWGVSWKGGKDNELL